VKFLALIIALALLQYWGSAGPVHRDQWFRDLVAKFSESGLMPELQITFAVLLPAILLFWLQGLIAGWLLGMVPLALMVVVLLYSFGRGNFEALLDKYRVHCREGDFEAAYLFAQQELAIGADTECPSGPEQLHRWVKERFFYLGFERWFGVVFYFALFGAAGALAYRLLQLYGEFCDTAERREMVRRTLQVVDWLPSRLLVFTFAVTGDWVGSREQMSAAIQDLETATGELVSDSAHAALGLKATVFSDNGDSQAFAQVSDWEMGQIQGLLSRSAVAWVVALALIVLLV
jgi:AmpE protein